MKILPDPSSVTAPWKPAFRRVLDFLMENAVLYFVSCCLLLLGIYLTIRSSWLPGGFLMRYCESYGIFFFYVIVLTVECFLVLRRLALVVDGLVMAGMALLLVLDPTFFNNVFYTYDLAAGLEVNSLCFLLGMGIYAALLRFGGIPWSTRSAAATVIAALFVYYYPVGFNIAMAPLAVEKYLYALWWIPLVVVAFCPRLVLQPEETPQSSPPAGKLIFSYRARQRFIGASMVIVVYIVFSHLMEANYTYSFDYRPEYLAPGFLAVGLLVFKLRQNHGRGERQFVWACAVLAFCCSGAASPVIQWPEGLALSSFHCGMGAISLFMLYFWKIYRGRSWVVAAILCLLLAVSGYSLKDSIFSIGNFHFVPFFLLAIVFAAVSVMKRVPVFPTLAGGCLLVALLALTKFPADDKAAIFMQLWAVWFALVQWHFYRNARQRVYALVGLFVFALALLLSWPPYSVAWAVDYLVVLIALFLAGRFLKNGFLLTLFASGTLGAIFYLARAQLLAIALAARQWMSSGAFVTILAFLLLPLAYYFSARKMHKQAENSSRPLKP